MTRWLLCLCVATFVGCTDGGPGTESPGGGAGAGGEGGANPGGTGGGGVGGSAGSAGAMAGAGGSGGSGGVAGNVGGVGGVGGAGGVGGLAGMGGMAGIMAGDDGGIDDEGFCTVECTGIAPDEGVAEACSLITEMAACEMHETGGFPASCRWVTPESEPCLAP